MMQFNLKLLFVAVFVSALLTIVVQFAIELLPQMYGPILLILAVPALPGLCLFAFSVAMIVRHRKKSQRIESIAISKYTSLAGIGIFFTYPLMLYIAFFCLVATAKR